MLILVSIVIVLAIIFLPDKIFTSRFKEYRKVDEIINLYNEKYSLSIYNLIVKVENPYGDKEDDFLEYEDNKKKCFVLQKNGFLKVFVLLGRCGPND